MPKLFCIAHTHTHARTFGDPIQLIFQTLTAQVCRRAIPFVPQKQCKFEIIFMQTKFFGNLKFRFL